MRRRAYDLFLMFTLLSCGVDGSTPKPTPMPTKIAEGPAKSGSDVRLGWVITDGGARVALGAAVYARSVSEKYGDPVWCNFLGGATDTRVSCVPTQSSAVFWDNETGLYADANCSTPLAVDNRNQRACSGTRVLFFVSTYVTDSCAQAPKVSEAMEVSPGASYARQLGACRAVPTDLTLYLYFSPGKSVDNVFPRGVRGIE